MILKKKWIDIMTENNTGVYSLTQQGLITLIQEVDDLFSQTYKDEGEPNDLRLYNIYNEITSHFTTVNESNNYWADMVIPVSSWTWRDKSIFGKLILRLTQYLGFYKKLLTDKGLARSVVTHRSYSNEGESDGDNRGFISETPRITLDNFEDAIKYASNLQKNTDHTESSTSGESDLTVTSKSYDEEERNMKYIFYNDLCDFIREIPSWLYKEYSLDSMPQDLIRRYYMEYFKDMYERR